MNGLNYKILQHNIVSQIFPQPELVFSIKKLFKL